MFRILIIKGAEQVFFLFGEFSFKRDLLRKPSPESGLRRLDSNVIRKMQVKSSKLNSLKREQKS